MRLSRTALVIERLLKNASSDISSSHSTKTCSSPPNVYLLSIVANPFSAHRSGERMGLQPCLKPPRMDIERCNIRIPHQRAMQGHRRFDALHREGIERSLHVRQRLVAGLTP